MKRIGDILNSAAFGDLRARAKRGDDINGAVREVLSAAGLSARCRALAVNDNGELTLAVASPAEAAAVRQMLPSLLAALNDNGENISAIRLRIQP